MSPCGYYLVLHGQPCCAHVKVISERLESYAHQHLCTKLIAFVQQTLHLSRKSTFLFAFDVVREDLRVSIELLPARLNVDQITLRHFLAFFLGPDEKKKGDAQNPPETSENSRRNSASQRSASNRSRGRSSERLPSARGGRGRHVSPSLPSAPSSHRPHSTASSSSRSHDHRRSNSNSRSLSMPAAEPFVTIDPFGEREAHGHGGVLGDRRSRSRSGSLSRGDINRPPSRGPFTTVGILKYDSY